MRRRSALALAVLGPLMLGACAAVEYTPKTGTVTELEYEAAEYWSEPECGYSTDYSGRYRYSCWTDSGVDPECWLVAFEDTAGQLWEDCTSEAVWKDLQVGDSYTED